MGMSTHVVGVRPPNEKWKKMKQVWDACESAGITIPDDVLEFFDYETPDPEGVVVYVPTRKYNDGNSQWGYEIHVKEIPKDVTIIRFYNAV